MKSSFKDVASAFATALGSFKKVSNPNITAVEWQKAFNTLEFIANVDENAQTVVIGGVAYQVDNYQILNALGKLMPAMAIRQPGTPYQTKNLRVKSTFTDDEILDPVKFINFQYKLANAVKVTPTMQSARELRVVKNLTEVPVVAKEIKKTLRVSCNDLTMAVTMPVKLTVTDQLYDDSFFEMDATVYWKALATNTFVNMCK